MFVLQIFQNETNFNHRCGKISFISYSISFRQIRKEKLHLVIGDLSLALAQRKTNDHKTQLQ
jgi:hypothetical protein